MVASCCAFGCKNRGIRETTKSFHRFPKDDQRRKVWIQNVHLLNWQPSKSSRICSDHFTEDSYIVRLDATVGDVRLLKSDAIPTVFPNYPKHLQKSLKKRKPPKKRIFEEAFDKTQAISSVEIEPLTKSIHSQTDDDFMDQVKRKTAANIKMRKEIHALKMKISRKNKRIETLQQMLNSLKKGRTLHKFSNQPFQIKYSLLPLINKTN